MAWFATLDLNSHKVIKCCLALLVVSSIGNACAAHHSRGHSRSIIRFGVVTGTFWRPWTYSTPYYYPPYVSSMTDNSPLVYIEQDVPPALEAAPAGPANYWYYCMATKAYYPYVNECPTGWQKVLQQAPGSQ